jgi:hypothetical protein
MERFFNLLFQFTAIMNYGYATVMLSSTTLVSYQNGLRVFYQMGLCGLVGRLVALWVLKVYPDEQDKEENLEKTILFKSGGAENPSQGEHGSSYRRRTFILIDSPALLASSMLRPRSQ